MRRQLLTYLSLATLLTACVPLEQRTAHFDNKWPAGTIKELEVTEVGGAITVTGDSPNEIRMSASVRASGVRPDPKKPYDGYITTEVDGDTLTIRTYGAHHNHGIFFGWGRDVRADYELHVPPQLALRMVTVNGRIETHGIAGETEAKTVNGRVNIEATGASEVEVRTVNGRIEAKFLHDFHGARLGTVNGRVTAVLPPTASFLGDFTQVNGDFEAAFPLNIHSNPGARRVSGEVNGGQYPLKISTVNGDITIENGAPPAPPPAPSAIPAPPAPPAAPSVPPMPAPRT